MPTGIIGKSIGGKSTVNTVCLLQNLRSIPIEAIGANPLMGITAKR